VQRLGKIENITADGNLLLKLSTTPGMGTRVFTPRNRPLGRVIDIIGPVNAPYAVVRVADGQRLLPLVGKDAYVR